MSAWAPADPTLRFRLDSSGAASQAVANTGMTALPTPSDVWAAEGKFWHPQSPIFALGVIAAFTVGLMAVSTSGGASVRVGKAVATVTGGAGVGSTK